MKVFLPNYVDDNILFASSSDIASLMDLLRQDSNTTIDWLITNYMIVNPKEFQAIVITKRNLQNNLASLSINNIKIKLKDSLELLEVTTDDKLTFEKHIIKLCRSASSQLNAIYRLISFFKFSSQKKF